MSTKQLILLAIVAGVMVALTGVLYVQPEAGPGEFQPGTPLIQGLDPADIQSIVISKDKDELTIRRSEDGFVLPGKEGYPASMDKINDLLINVLDIRCAQMVAESPEKYANFGVEEDDSSAVTVSFVGGDGQQLIAFVKGKSPENGMGAYVRLVEEKAVYLTEDRLFFDLSPMHYVDKTILDVDTETIQTVDVNLPESNYSLQRGQDDDIRLVDVPEGMEPKSDSVESVFGALESLRINDVKSAESMEVAYDGRYVCRLDDEVVYTVRTAEENGKVYARLSARGPDVEQVTVERTESEESLKKKDALLRAADRASEFNSRHKDWVYEIPDSKADNLRKPLSELVEEKEAKKPEEIGVRHILISYKGAKRSESDRSKAEAKQLAEKVLEKARAEDADFAKLASEYSDGPSADKGGDLGTFGSGKMTPAFEEAAFALDVDQISGVVETPFGFHIIHRTR